jgi:ankyrin repeat protein
MLNKTLTSILITGWFYAFAVSAATDSDMQLIEFVKQGDHNGLRTLLDEKKDVNVTQPDGSTSLAWAVYNDDLVAMDLLIKAGANPDLANEYGVTPLSLACSNRNPAAVERLLDAGANPNATLWTGETVLMTCSRAGSLNSIKALLAKGAKVNAKEGRRGQTALMWAISQGYPEIAHLLVNAGADVRAKSQMLADVSPKTYLTHDGLVQVSSEGGFTPLLFAAQQGDLQTAKLLVEAGADVNHATKEDGNSLLLASANGHEDVALYLLNKGADSTIAAGDGSDITPLHYALRDGMRALLEGKGAGLFSAVVDEEQKSVTKKVKKKNPFPGRNMPRLIEALLERGADPNAQMHRLPARFRKGGNGYVSVKGVTPFLLAAAASDIHAMQFLVEMGGNSDINSVVDEEANPVGVYKDQAQFQGSVTPLLAASGLGRRAARKGEEGDKALETVKLLVEMGADVNETNETGWTPLHAATYIGAEPIIEYLVKEGANLDAKNGCGQTPLTLADGTLGRGQVVIPRARVSTSKLLTELGAGANLDTSPIGRCVEGRYGIAFFVERDNKPKE